MWLIFALLSAIFAALVGVLGKVGLQSVDANSATSVRAVIMAIFLVAVIAVQGKFAKVSEIFADSKALTFICFSGIAGALSWLFYFLALKYGKVTQVAPIDKLSVVFAAIIAIAFLGERVSMLGGAGIALIAVGAIMVAFS